MSAYFSLIFEFETNGAETLVQDFYDCLEKNGVHFLQGARKAAAYSRKQLIAENQSYLKSYLNGTTEKDGGMYQSLFRFLTFTEVRGYWDLCEGWHLWDANIFHLIIPEDDFFDSIYKSENHVESNMEDVKNLCVRLWEMPMIRAIQTEWEDSDCSPEFREICTGADPQTEPFSIIPYSVYRPHRNVIASRIARDGILLEKR